MDWFLAGLIVMGSEASNRVCRETCGRRGTCQQEEVTICAASVWQTDALAAQLPFHENGASPDDNASAAVLFLPTVHICDKALTIARNETRKERQAAAKAAT
jgi:hypothetical protein